MSGASLEKILNLPPGAFLRTGSGFFQKLPTGEVAFLPSLCRMPWHLRHARIVGPQDIAKLLRTETFEMLIGVALLFLCVHFFIFDILNLYMDMMSLPLAVTTHLLTVYASIVAILRINNAPFAILRSRMMIDLPSAESVFSLEGLSQWRGGRRVWSLSFMSGAAVDNLGRQAVILYLLLFACSGPLLVGILFVMILSGAAQKLGGYMGIGFALYCALSLWAFVESSLVLAQRMRAGRRRRLARQRKEGGYAAPSQPYR
jgi:hypothetical protein